MIKKHSYHKILSALAGGLLLSVLPVLADESNSDISAHNAIAQAVSQLENAEQLDSQSRRTILEANSIRKQLMTLRAATRNSTENAAPDNEKLIAKLVTELSDKQALGAKMRSESEALKQQAIINFEKGFVARWSRWVTNREPLTMDSTVENYFAHNSKIRSVHKNMPQNADSAAVKVEQRDNMSLQVAALVNQNAPPDLDINAFKFSRKEQHFAHIEVHNEVSIAADYPSSNSQSSISQSGSSQSSNNQSSNVSAVPLNQIHQWRLLVADLAGNPATGLQIIVEGHMPGHVHGLPTAPRVTREILPGVYLVDGMKFQMKGWWVIKFILMPEQADPAFLPQADFFTFNLVL